ncbi:MAG: molybdopterin dinucleotide binding domain-containing protein [Promethearchaeota archaeon]
MAKLEGLTLVTGRTVEQGIAFESGGEGQDLVEHCARCELAEEDLQKLGVKSGARVEVSTSSGSVVLKVAAAGEGARPGVVFVPVGPWANVLIDSDTGGTGIPLFKGIPATVQGPAAEPVLSAEELALGK